MTPELKKLQIETEKLIRLNVLRDIEIGMLKGKPVTEVIKELEVEYILGSYNIPRT